MTQIPDRIAASTAGLPRRSRLTDVERAERRMPEAELQRLVTDLAEAYGWSWVHFRAGLRANGRWYVPVEGPMGRGWPDLVLARARGRDRRLLFVELKRQLGRTTPEQEAVQSLLLEIGLSAGLNGAAISTGPRLADVHPQVDYRVWRPSDIRDPIQDSVIGRILQ